MVGMLGLAVATIGFSLASNYWVLIIARIGQGSAGGASWYIEANYRRPAYTFPPLYDFILLTCPSPNVF